MKYTPPKTRIKITKKVDGTIMYQPQWKVFLCWEAMMGDPLYWVKDYGNLKTAQERIDKFLACHEKQYKQDVGDKVDSVEYVKYP